MLPGKSQHFQKWVTLGTWTMEQVSSTKKKKKKTRQLIHEVLGRKHI